MSDRQQHFDFGVNHLVCLSCCSTVNQSTLEVRYRTRCNVTVVRRLIINGAKQKLADVTCKGCIQRFKVDDRRNCAECGTPTKVIY
jgi:hypothetical protein